MPEGKKKLYRLQIKLPQDSMDRLERLQEATEAASMAEVARNALRLYEAVIKGVDEGRPFYQQIDGEMVPVVIVNA